MKTPSKAIPGLQQLAYLDSGEGILILSLASVSLRLSQLGSSLGAQDIECARLTLSVQEEPAQGDSVTRPLPQYVPIQPNPSPTDIYGLREVWLEHIPD